MNRKKNKESSEFERFEMTVEALMRVPHSEVKAKLEQEKKAKKERGAKKRNNHDKRNADIS
jgi:hypothetical protein